MVYVPPLTMYYHGLCTIMVYVLPWSMYYHGLCTTMVLPSGALGLPVALFGVPLGSLGLPVARFGAPFLGRALAPFGFLETI